MNGEMMENAKSVLLCDDDPTTRAEVRRELAGRFELVEAENGLDAVRQLHQRRFDCVIVDLTLPVVSAYEVLRRAKDPHTTTVALSTASRHQLKNFEGSVADAVVQKVHELGHLAGLVTRAVA
jgi:PleD family two-component response regulator